jgi:hypothetical protein
MRNMLEYMKRFNYDKINFAIIYVTVLSDNNEENGKLHHQNATINFYTSLIFVINSNKQIKKIEK